MDNNISKNINPYFQEFLNPNEIQEDNPLAQTMQNLDNNKLKAQVLGNLPSNSESIIENKIQQQISDKTINTKRGSFYLSRNSLKQLGDSLKNVRNIFSSEESLSLRKMEKISQEHFDQLKETIIKSEDLSRLHNTLKNINWNFKLVQLEKSVGGIVPLTYLIESFYLVDETRIKEMIDKYNALKGYIYNYRSINGDGNCFYRAVMFRYLEIFILNEKIEYTKSYK